MEETKHMSEAREEGGGRERRRGLTWCTVQGGDAGEEIASEVVAAGRGGRVWSVRGDHVVDGALNKGGNFPWVSHSGKQAPNAGNMGVMGGLWGKVRVGGSECLRTL